MSFLLSNIVNNNLLLNLTINDVLSFSYPVEININDVFVQDSVAECIVKTNSGFKRTDPDTFTNYKSLKGKFSFDYPSAFVLDEKELGGDEIIYHIDFSSKKYNSHGFIQVWNLTEPLDKFLENAKSTAYQSFEYFHTKSVTIDNEPGFYWDYLMISKDNKKYKGSEVFYKKGDKMYRISYFVPNNKWNKNQENIFWSMVNSFKTL